MDYVIDKAKKEKCDIVVWRYDRAFRNRKDFFIFMKEMFEVYGIKVYSVKELSILSLWNMLDKSYSEDPAINGFIKGIFKTLWDFLIQQAGEEAEEESTKKSQRVKLAVRKEEGQKTKSYKNNLWGRKSLNQEVVSKIKQLREKGKSITQICKEVSYWDKNNNRKFVSRAVVHKIIHQID